MVLVGFTTLVLAGLIAGCLRVRPAPVCDEVSSLALTGTCFCAPYCGDGEPRNQIPVKALRVVAGVASRGVGEGRAVQASRPPPLAGTCPL